MAADGPRSWSLTSLPDKLIKIGEVVSLEPREILSLIAQLRASPAPA
jgi:hypothetical protein